MGLSDYLLFQTVFLILFTLFLLPIRNRIPKGMLARTFALGFAGWLLAFLRIILIQLWQLFLLIRSGVNYLNAEEVANSPVVYTYEFNLIGPLLSGLFEEPVRYLFLFAALKDPSDRSVRKYLPLVFGLGWAYSEIMVVTLGFISVGSVSGVNLAISMYERIMATLLHVCLTYVVLYARIDRKRSLWLAILVHDAINTAVVIMLLELRHLEPLRLTLLVEGLLTVMVLLFVGYARIHVRKREVYLEKVT